MARLPIIMPKMSMTMTEGDVSAWMVEVGDTISEGDVVCEVMTDKVNMEVESPVSGVLTEILVEEGAAEVGAPIAWVEGEASALGDLLSDDEPSPPADVDPDPGEAEPGPAEPGPTDVRAAAPPPPTDRTGPRAAVPRARALAREHGVDLGSVHGSGRDGLVTVADVEALVAPPARRAPAKNRAALIRGAVAAKMIQSASVPQFTVWRDLRLDAADARRDDVGWTTLLLQAYAAALREVPELLTRWEGDEATDSGPPSIALAVATPDGLLGPVIAEPDRRPADQLDREIREMVTAARAGRLDPAYLGVPNGSLSNLGGMGVDRFQALITPPQASVLALGSIRRRPVAVAGGLGTALTLTAGLTVDHRVGDGAHAAALLDAFARRVEGEGQAQEARTP